MRVKMNDRQLRIPPRKSLHDRVSNGVIAAQRYRTLALFQQLAHRALISAKSSPTVAHASFSFKSPASANAPAAPKSTPNSVQLLEASLRKASRIFAGAPAAPRR